MLIILILFANKLNLQVIDLSQLWQIIKVLTSEITSLQGAFQIYHPSTSPSERIKVRQ
jgi:hypothetical protein